MRVGKVLKAILGFTREAVIMGVEVLSGTRPVLRVHRRPKVCRRGRCGELAAWFDNRDGVRSWRHLDAELLTVELVAVARRVDCASCGPTVARVLRTHHGAVFARIEGAGTAPAAFTPASTTAPPPKPTETIDHSSPPRPHDRQSQPVRQTASSPLRPTGSC